MLVGFSETLHVQHRAPQYWVKFVCFWRDSPQWVRASSFTRFIDHTQLDTAQSVGFLWTSDQLVAETST